MKQFDIKRFNKRFFINLKESEKPKWVEGKTWEQQHPYTAAFYKNECKKLFKGINIKGVEIHPWLYWHVNYWPLAQDKLEKKTDMSFQRIGRQTKVARLRDNEWLINENLLEAERERLALALFGTRRFGKTAFIASYTAFSAHTKKNSNNYVVGGDSGDLGNVQNYINDARPELPPWLRLDTIAGKWDDTKEGVKIGTKFKNGPDRVFSRMFGINVAAGSKGGSLKTAGHTPSSMVVDETGKFALKAMWQQALPAFQSDGGHGFRFTPILLGTGGSVSKSEDIQSMLNDPVGNKILPVDWRNYRVPAKYQTWQKRNWGIFVPAQMSLFEGLVKKKMSLSKFLKKDVPLLDEIKIEVSNWKKAKEILEAAGEEKKKSGNDNYVKFRMAYPLTPADCFLKTGESPFKDIVGIREHRDHLKASGDVGRSVYFTPSVDKKGKILKYDWEDSGKPIAPFPRVKKGILDAGILMLEPPPDVFSYPDYSFVAGLDHVKTDKTITDSLISLYVIKRMLNIRDEFSDSIVCSYTTRPETLDIANNNIENILKAYGAKVLQEGMDMSFLQHIRSKNQETLYMFRGKSISDDRTPFGKRAKNTSQNEWGLPATKHNKQYIMSLVATYVNELVILDTDEDGNPTKVMKGYKRIKDIGLLDEILAYYDGLNVDRIVAFGHALAQLRYIKGKFINLPEVKPITKEHRNHRSQVLRKRNSTPVRSFRGNAVGHPSLVRRLPKKSETSTPPPTKKESMDRLRIRVHDYTK